MKYAKPTKGQCNGKEQKPIFGSSSKVLCCEQVWIMFIIRQTKTPSHTDNLENYKLLIDKVLLIYLFVISEEVVMKLERKEQCKAERQKKNYVYYRY